MIIQFIIGTILFAIIIALYLETKYMLKLIHYPNFFTRSLSIVNIIWLVCGIVVYSILILMFIGVLKWKIIFTNLN